MIDESEIYVGNKLKGKNNNIIFKILDIHKAKDGFTYIKLKASDGKKYEILKQHFKCLLLIPLIEKEVDEDVD